MQLGELGAFPWRAVFPCHAFPGCLQQEPPGACNSGHLTILPHSLRGCLVKPENLRAWLCDERNGNSHMQALSTLLG